MAVFDQTEFSSLLEASGARVTEALGTLLPNDGGRLHAAMRYAALSSGKMFRPFLVIESAKLFDVDVMKSMRTAAALECIHCYSLVHDDLPAMDNDDLRRGKPTTHRKFDEATAILAGDALLTFAFELLAHQLTHPAAEVRVELIRRLALASGESGMVGGQMLDILAEANNNATLESIAVIQSKKTGALIEFACVAGAILAKKDPGPLQEYAQSLGLAFQIADDVLDVESSPATLGKATQKDAARGKATFVDILGLKAAKKKALALADQACAALSSFGPKAEALRQAAHYVVIRQK